MVNYRIGYGFARDNKRCYMERSDIISVKRDKAGEIKAFINENIKKGRYSDRLPSLNQLAGHFDVNIKTAKRAISALEKEGLVVSHKGKGTFINKKSIEPAPILFIGREGKEISATLSSVLASVIEYLELDYIPYIFLLPKIVKDKKYDIPKLPNLAGILVEDMLIDHINIKASDLPIVQLHSTGDNGIPAIRPDVEDGMVQVIDYLKSLGHEKVAYLGPDSNLDNNLDNLKRESFLRCVKERNMKTKDSWNTSGFYRVETGYTAAMTVLRHKEHPTAFVCVNDEVALGTLNACEEVGLEVPDDITVIGFDDRAPAIMRKPFLTTVRVNFKQIAIDGIKLIHKYNRDPKSVILESPPPIPVNLVIRETAGGVK